MKTKAMTIAGISTALAVGAMGAAAVSVPVAVGASPGIAAQQAGDTPSADPTTSAPDDASGGAHAGQRGERLRRFLRGAVRTASSTIGIAPQELVTELRDGKSVSQVATEHGVEPQAVIDDLVAAGSAKVDDAVAAGKLTTEQGERIKARLPEVAQKLVDHVGGGRPGR